MCHIISTSSLVSYPCGEAEGEQKPFILKSIVIETARATTGHLLCLLYQKHPLGQSQQTLCACVWGCMPTHTLHRLPRGADGRRGNILVLALGSSAAKIERSVAVSNHTLLIPHTHHVSHQQSDCISNQCNKLLMLERMQVMLICLCQSLGRRGSRCATSWLSSILLLLLYTESGGAGRRGVVAV